MKLILAPIQNITVAHYRNLYAQIFGGIDAYYAPFISTTNMRKSSPALFKDLFPESNNGTLDIVPQLLGNNGIDFRYYASTIVDLGYKEINWNIGCPFHTVTKKIKGSGILPYPDMIKEFLDEVCLDDSYKLTVKMRLGWDNLEEGIDVIEVLNQYPLSDVIIHGRTGVQKYEGTVDLDSFEVLNSACKHDITYNGDIFSYNDFKIISERFPSINNFMIGRGALRDPFLPSLIKGNDIPNTEKSIKIKAFHDSIYNHNKSTASGDRLLCNKMKEFWTYTATIVDPNSEYINKIKKCLTTEAYLDIVDQMLDSYTP